MIGPYLQALKACIAQSGIGSAEWAKRHYLPEEKHDKPAEK
jgi:hypothetical protein